ncbi:hypothetical protein ACHQM5_021097 [Ranunculus cassubicifolius]
MANTGILLVMIVIAAFIQSSTCHVVKGSVSCLDCKHHDDLSGVHVVMKCEKVKQYAMATTEKDGSFETELTADPSSTTCQAQLLGGPKQLCSYKKTIAANIVKAYDTKSYTLSTPLDFYTSCPSAPSNAKSGRANPKIDSSKTIDLPLPREWGMPPTSLYMPIFPIGIP